MAFLSKKTIFSPVHPIDHPGVALIDKEIQAEKLRTILVNGEGHQYETASQFFEM